MLCCDIALQLWDLITLDDKLQNAVLHGKLPVLACNFGHSFGWLIAGLISAGYYSPPIFTIQRIWIVLGRCSHIFTIFEVQLE